jgi:hypothetical protein
LVLLDLFSTVTRAPGPVFLGSFEGVGSSFHVLRSQTHLRLYRERRVKLSCFALPDSFLAISRVPGSVFSCFALLDPFSEVNRVSSPAFMFCAHVLILGGIEGSGSIVHV